ncbi:hypothetical protein JB92DRAFT_626746 [Gautieria morchelliformis]|nr:hypothetical protein JB92DRAFT_626746 [Gautieria morchelliformis]
MFSKVFGHLHPLDLLHLSRTSKELRRVLMSRHSTFVWKTARLRIKGFPTCPDDLSEPQYARLAFETTCHKCGKSRTLKIDWNIRVRSCQPCLKASLVWSAKFEKRYPEFPSEIMNLLPYTRSPNSNGHETTSRFFWEPAILLVAEQLKRLRLNVMLKEAGAVDIIKFKASKETEISQILSHARLCDRWVSMAAMERSNESAAAQRRRIAAIKAKLQELNWSPQEISAVSCHSSFGPAQDLTDRRLEIERQAYNERRKPRVFSERRFIATKLYNSYVAGASQYHRALPTVQIQESDFADVKKDLPILIAHWESVQEQQFLSLLPAVRRDSQCIVSPLKLAVNVLKCGHCSTFVMCSDALTHARNSPSCLETLAFWESVSDIIRNIIVTLGLDPHTTTEDELDHLDPRILCLECAPTLSKNDKPCRLAMSWRCCIDHFRLGHLDIPTSRWQVLDHEQTRQIKVAEGVSEDHKLRAWYCKICVNLTAKDLSTYAKTVGHVRIIHQKDQPVLGVDFTRNPNIRRLRHQSLFFGDPELLDKKWKVQSPKPPKPPKPFRCMHCLHQPGRMFEKMGVYQHLRDKHGIANPVMGTDLTEPSMAPHESTRSSDF